ncbi:MAG: ABC transporter permease [Bacteroidales bacterium]|nr:ABC transporter permease [Bacteroidales bacterium]
MRTISVIISREYMTRVKKKSFLVITFLGPLFFAAMCLLPSLIMFFAKDKAKTVGYLDESGFVSEYLVNTDLVTYFPYQMVDEEQLKVKVNNGDIDAYMIIGVPDSTLNVPVKMASDKSISMDLKESVASQVEDAVEAARIEQTGIEGLSEIMKNIKPSIDIKTSKFSSDGDEKATSTEVTMMISLILSMIIYMFITIFASSVMTSVIEEKSSRVVEVLISSVKSTELMFGKIIGVAGVALTQFLLWILLTGILVGGGMAVMGPKIAQSAQDMTQMTAMPGMDMQGMDMMDTEAVMNAVSQDSELGGILEAVKNINFTELIVAFLIFFVLGYLLYASLFAAIGSAGDNEADTQQLQIPVTLPLLIAFFIAFYAFKAPDSPVVFWGSMIPFTSPIVMLARIPSGDVMLWEYAVSIGLLLLTFVGCAWVSAKIYKVGILMYGKKNSFKDLWRWLRQK